MRVQSTFGTLPGWGSSSASGGGAFVVKFSGHSAASRGESWYICFLQALSGTVVFLLEEWGLSGRTLPLYCRKNHLGFCRSLPLA